MRPELRAGWPTCGFISVRCTVRAASVLHQIEDVSHLSIPWSIALPDARRRLAGQSGKTVRRRNAHCAITVVPRAEQKSLNLSSSETQVTRGEQHGMPEAAASCNVKGKNRKVDRAWRRARGHDQFLSRPTIFLPWLLTADPTPQIGGRERGGPNEHASLSISNPHWRIWYLIPSIRVAVSSHEDSRTVMVRVVVVVKLRSVSASPVLGNPGAMVAKD